MITQGSQLPFNWNPHNFRERSQFFWLERNALKHSTWKLQTNIRPPPEALYLLMIMLRLGKGEKKVGKSEWHAALGSWKPATERERPGMHAEQRPQQAPGHGTIHHSMRSWPWSQFGAHGTGTVCSTLRIHWCLWTPCFPSKLQKLVHVKHHLAAQPGHQCIRTLALCWYPQKMICHASDRNNKICHFIYTVFWFSIPTDNSLAAAHSAHMDFTPF